MKTSLAPALPLLSVTKYPKITDPYHCLIEKTNKESNLPFLIMTCISNGDKERYFSKLYLIGEVKNMITNGDHGILLGFETQNCEIIQYLSSTSLSKTSGLDPLINKGLKIAVNSKLRAKLRDILNLQCSENLIDYNDLPCSIK